MSANAEPNPSFSNEREELDAGVTCRDAALSYRQHGWSVIPVRHGTKQAAIKWVAYQHHLPTVAKIDEWWPADDPDRHGVAIICGRISGLIVVDVDPRNGGDRSLRELEEEGNVLPKTVTVHTGRGDGGFHAYLRSDDAVACSKVAPGVDLRADGGYVVAPPSLHLETGVAYAFSDVRDMAECPPWLTEGPSIGKGADPERQDRLEHPSPTDLVGRGASSLRPAMSNLGEQLPEGARNDALTHLAGRMRNIGLSAKAIDAALQVVNVERARPALSRGEVSTIAKSIGRYNAGDDSAEADPRWRIQILDAVLTDVLKDGSYTSADGMWALALSYFGDESYPSLETLGRTWGGSAAVAAHHVNAVAEAERIKVTPRRRENGSFTSNQYTFVLPTSRHRPSP